MNFTLFLINKKGGKKSQLELTELGRKHEECEMYCLCKKWAGQSSRDQAQVDRMSSWAV